MKPVESLEKYGWRKRNVSTGKKFVVVNGRSRRSRLHLGALLLGYYRDDRLCQTAASAQTADQQTRGKARNRRSNSR